jgi:hypothetical protein
VLANIYVKHGPDASGFMIGGEVFPKPNLVMASNFSLDILAKSHYVIVNGTFSTTERKMVLTTILGFHDGVPISCVYFLSELRDTKSYKYFFEVLLSILSFFCIAYTFINQKVKEFTGNMMNPKRVLLDFEEALGAVFRLVFSGLWCYVTTFTSSKHK